MEKSGVLQLSCFHNSKGFVCKEVMRRKRYSKLSLFLGTQGSGEIQHYQFGDGGESQIIEK